MTEEDKHKQLTLVGAQVAKTIRFTFPHAKGVVVMMGFIDNDDSNHAIFLEDNASHAESCKIAVGCIGSLDQHYINPEGSNTI